MGQLFEHSSVWVNFLSKGWVAEDSVKVFTTFWYVNPPHMTLFIRISAAWRGSMPFNVLSKKVGMVRNDGQKPTALSTRYP